MRHFIVGLLLCFSVSPAFADYVSMQDIGNFTYSNGTINGQSYNATTQRIGNFEYTNGTIDGRSFNTTTQQIGSFKYTNGDFGIVGSDGDCDR